GALPEPGGDGHRAGLRVPLDDLDHHLALPAGTATGVVDQHEPAAQQPAEAGPVEQDRQPEQHPPDPGRPGRAGHALHVAIVGPAAGVVGRPVAANPPGRSAQEMAPDGLERAGGPRYTYVMADPDLDERLRLAVFAHLDRVSAAHPDGIPSSVINTFTFDGEPMRLVVQPGIWKPARLSAALTIRTTYTPPGRTPPYEDRVGPDGLVRYKWRGTDPEEPDNRALREAMRQRRPLVYFHAVAKGVYHAFYPVYLVGEDPEQHEVLLDTMPPLDEPAPSPLERAYARRLTLHRLHQALFRPRVLRAYGTRCALCRLRHASLLDAAHILPDGHPRGDPVGPNGLALCKIHHAAYDVNIIGIRADYVVHVRRDVLTEIDGPMLRHGLQEMHGTRIHLPRSPAERPDRERLELRYEQFVAAA